MASSSVAALPVARVWMNPPVDHTATTVAPGVALAVEESEARLEQSTDAQAVLRLRRCIAHAAAVARPPKIRSGVWYGTKAPTVVLATDPEPQASITTGKAQQDSLDSNAPKLVPRLSLPRTPLLTSFDVAAAVAGRNV